MSSPLSSTTIESASEPVVGIAAGALAAAPEGAEGELAADWSLN